MKAGQFENALEGKGKDGELLVRAQGNRRPGVDLTFSAPKSVSIIGLVNGDVQAIAAHHEAVKVALGMMEREFIQTRIMENGVSHIEKTGNGQLALWQHDTSRNLDPQLHTHAILMNQTIDRTGKWRTIDNTEIYRNSMLIGAVYHNELAKRLHETGYQTVWNKDGTFEVVGYTREQIEAFSSRREDIIAEVGADASAARRDIAAKKTRKAKVNRVDRTELHHYWKKLADDNGIIHPRPNLERAEEVRQRSSIVGGAKEVLGDKEVAFNERELLKESLRQSQGSYTLEGLEQEISREKAEGQILSTPDGRLTTEEAVSREQRIIRVVNAGKGTQNPIGSRAEVQAIALEKTFNQGQLRGLDLIGTTEDRIIIIQGDAGVGKSYTLAGARELAEAKELKIRGLAPSAQSAEILESESGIPSQTLDSYLMASIEQLTRGEILVLDEAGQASARHLDELLKRAEATDSRVILTGDGKQLSGVQAGSPFLLLQNKSEVKVAIIDESMRQKDPSLKEVVSLIAKGKIEDSYTLLQNNGKVVEIRDQDERTTAFANEYLHRSPEVRKQTLMLAGTNTERKLVTEEVRKGLKAEGSLGDETKTIEVLRTKNLDSWEKKQVAYYEVGDVVQFNRDYAEFKKSESYTVTEMDRRLGMLTLQDSNGDNHQSSVKKHLEREVFQKEGLELAVGDRGKFTKNDRRLNVLNGQEFIIKELREDGSFLVTTKGRDKVYRAEDLHHSDHNYVSTVYSSQGKTAKYVMYDADSSRALSIGKEAYYVAVSRGKEEVLIYASEPQALGVQIKVSRVNENALELLDAKVESPVAVGVEEKIHKEETHDQRNERKQARRTWRFSRDLGRRAAERFGNSPETDKDRPENPQPESGKPDIGSQSESDSGRVEQARESLWESDYYREIIRANGFRYGRPESSENQSSVPEREQQSEPIRAHVERDGPSVQAGSGAGENLAKDAELGDGKVERITGSPGDAGEDSRVEVRDGISARNPQEVGGPDSENRELGKLGTDSGSTVGGSRNEPSQGNPEIRPGTAKGNFGGDDQEASRTGEAVLRGEEDNFGMGQEHQQLADQQPLEESSRAVAKAVGLNADGPKEEIVQLRRSRDETLDSLGSGGTAGSEPASNKLDSVVNIPNTPSRPDRATENQRQKIEEAKRLAAELREQPLEEVAQILGMERDKLDKKKWRGDGQVYSFTGEKFYNHTTQKGAGGAIDFVMDFKEIGYPEAVDWLKERFSTSEGIVESPAISRTEEPRKAEPKPPFVAPIQNDSKWPAVRDYLVNERMLSPILVDGLHNQGLLYADSKQNAVWLRHKLTFEEGKFVRGEVTGANLRGTFNASTFKGLAEGSAKADGWHWFALGEGVIKKIVLTEAPIDAASVAMLDKDREGVRVYLPTDGSGDIPSEQIREAMDQGARLVVAYDSTEIGSESSKKASRQAADRVVDKVLTPYVRKVMEEGGEVLVVKKGRKEGQPLLSRAMPPRQKDWNEHLQAKVSIEEKPPAQQQKQEPNQGRGLSR